MLKLVFVRRWLVLIVVLMGMVLLLLGYVVWLDIRVKLMCWWGLFRLMKLLVVKFVSLCFEWKFIGVIVLLLCSLFWF